MTAGWGTGLTLAAIGLAFAISPRLQAQRRWALPTLCGALVPVLVGVAINWAKFRHAVLIPFDDQAWTDLSWRRRRALREGGVDDIRFVPSTIYNYLRPWGIQFSSVFPFIATPSEPARSVGGVFLEMPYQTPSATATMPALFVLGGFGVFYTFRSRPSEGFAMLRIPLLGALSIVGGVLMVGYITPRYLAEFVPFLILASVAGVCGLVRRPQRHSRLAIAGLTGIAALAAFGTATNLAIATTAARVGTGGSPLLDYVAAQHWISERTGNPMDSMVEVGRELPATSAFGHIRILGDCDAMYYGTGDLFEPWVPFDFRDLHVQIQFDATDRTDPIPGRIPVVRFDGASSRSILVELDTVGRYRLVSTGSESTESSPWRTPGSDPIDLWIVGQLEWGRYLIASPGHLYTTVASGRLQPDLRQEPTTVITGDQEFIQHGFKVLATPAPESGLCRDLLDKS